MKSPNHYYRIAPETVPGTTSSCPEIIPVNPKRLPCHSGDPLRKATVGSNDVASPTLSVPKTFSDVTTFGKVSQLVVPKF